MASLTSQVCTNLAAVAGMAPVIEGRVFNNRPIKQGGANATPEAFDENGLVKPSLVVMNEGAISDILRDDAASEVITVWMHGPMTANGLEKLEGDMYVGVLSLLDHDYVATNGTGVELVIGDRFGVQQDPTIENAYVDYLRFTATRLWR